MTIETFTNFHKPTDPVDKGGFGSEEVFATKVINNNHSSPMFSLASGSGLTSVYTVPGVELGDHVLVSADFFMEDLTITAYVEEEGRINIRVFNGTGTVKNAPAHIWKVKVIKDGLGFS